MEHYAGIDVSLEREQRVRGGRDRADRARGQGGERAGGADRLVPRARRRGGAGRAWRRARCRSGCMRRCARPGLAVELLETRHVRDAFKAMPVKTDRKDARGIAQLMRLGWFRPVHCKSLPAQETRALLTARKLLQTKHHDVEMSLRGVLRGFGLKVGPTTARSFRRRGSASWWSGHPTLTRSPRRCWRPATCSGSSCAELEKRLRDQAREDRRGPAC